MIFKVTMENKNIGQIFDLYDVSQTSDLYRDHRGMINETWFVGEDAVLTIFQNRSFEEVKLISEIVQNDQSDLLPKIIIGKNGPVGVLLDRPVIMWKRIPGKHYVGIDHSQKEAIPEAAHASIAKAFWCLHGYLAKHLNDGAILGQITYLPSDTDQGADIDFYDLPGFLQKEYVADYFKTNSLPLKYLTLVHRDIERQNILHDSCGVVKGVVDADALMIGDLLFEYGHCMMNFLFSDPLYKSSCADVYMSELKKSGLIRPEDLKLLPQLIRFFAAKDLVDYHRLDHPPKTDLFRLSAIYDIGLKRMDDYFSSQPLIAAVRPQRYRQSLRPQDFEGAK